MESAELFKTQVVQDLAKILAERTTSNYAWIGAGFSIPAGLPSWVGLRKKLHDAGTEKAKTFEPDSREKKLLQLRAIEASEDPWVAFERLKDEVGAETYRSTIRRELDASNARPSSHYETLLKISWRGVLSLNLDELCRNQLIKEGHNWTYVSGTDAARMAHLLKAPRPTLVSLHGELERESSWVLTKSDLRELLANEGYRTFVKSIFLGNVVVFMGVGADDISTGGFLQSLDSIGIATSGHYWITDRSDNDTDKWAERLGVRVIRYSSADNHRQFLQLLEYLAAYKSLDESAPVVINAPSTQSRLPQPDELQAKSPEEIRERLNARAAEVRHDLGAFEALKREYKRCIQLAWLVDTAPPDNVFFGSVIERQIGIGAFGRVYSASDESGRPLAIKVLHRDVFDKPDMYGSFRRGVRSLQFLKEDGIPGVVRIEQAYDIPPSIVMEYVSGLTLIEATDRGDLRDWKVKLRVAHQICSIIRVAHSSTHRVLHRDIRPHNIILRGYFSIGDEIEVSILDFDLSWHRDSTEQSVFPHVEGALGYGAPEQFDPARNARARTTLVDSFGLGMTLLFLALARHPKPQEQEHVDWHETIATAVGSQSNSSWRSLPARYARLIMALTYSEQSRRLDFEAARLTLLELNEIYTPVGPSASVLAEELMCRTVDVGGYKWDVDRECALAPIAGGTMKASGDYGEEEIEVTFEWLNPGDRQHSTVVASLHSIAQFVEARFAPLGWRLEKKIAKERAVFTLQANVTAVANQLDISASLLQQTRSKFGF